MERDDTLTWFGIAAADLGRATRFYETVLGRSMKAETMGNATMSLFPYQQPGVGGCVIGGDGHVPSPSGTVVYDADAQVTSRRVRPLGLYFWGDAWTLGAWCELRRDFRNFRLDRIAALQVADVRYPDEAGKRLEDYIRKMQED